MIFSHAEFAELWECKKSGECFAFLTFYSLFEFYVKKIITFA